MLVAAALGFLGAGCGDDEPAAGPVVASLPTRQDWCAAYAEALPALAAPNPDGQELEVLDLHIVRARALAGGAPDVPAAAVDAAAEVEAGYVEIRARVAGGEELADVLADVFADDDSELVDAAATVDAEAGAVC